MGLLDRVRSFVARSQKTETVVDGGATGALGQISGTRALSPSPKRNADLLRKWSRTNEFLRTAITRRKQQIAQAKWQLVRRDKPNAQVDAGVEKQVRDLFDLVNPRGDSFRSLLDVVIEDLLILDAGCIEIERTLGGQIVNLWPVNGATITPLAGWDGTNPNAPRYAQIIPGMLGSRIELRNDQLIYMMANPSTHSLVGWSPVETLLRVVRAELYGEDYNYEQIQRMAPRGLLYVGGITPQQKDQFKAYLEDEILGRESIGITGGPAGSKPEFIPLTADDFEGRLAYMRWLATKIAAVFQMDLLVFNLSESVQKSVGKTLTARTDEGATALAKLVEEYLTREIVWSIDPTRRHAFQFDDLNDRDALAQAKVDQIYMSIGKTFPNELRARDGEDPVPWGDEPYAATQSQFAGDDPGDGEEQDPNDQEPGENAAGKGFAKRTAPFAGASTRRAKTRSTAPCTASWHRSSNGSTPPST